MNREEAIDVFEKIKAYYKSDPNWGVYDGVFSRQKLTEILDAYAILHSPQPDPITGLVPCGCKGKPEYHSSKYGYVASVKMHAECPGCHAKTAEYYAFLYSDDAYEVLQRRVMGAWNTMRGYKK